MRTCKICGKPATGKNAFHSKNEENDYCEKHVPPEIKDWRIRNEQRKSRRKELIDLIKKQTPHICPICETIHIPEEVKP